MKFFFALLFAYTSFVSSGQILNTLSPGEKVYGLSKIWQEVNYNFVYFNRVDKTAWDSTYLSMITEVQQTKNDYEYYKDLQRFMALLKDGHSTVSFPESTYGITGQPYLFDLPGGGSARVCTAKDTYPDGREFVGYGVKPDIEVKPTVQDFINHKDPVVDKALEYLNGKTK